MHNSAKMEMRGVKGSLVISIVSDRDPRLPHGFGLVYRMPLALNCTSLQLSSIDRWPI